MLGKELEAPRTGRLAPERESRDAGVVRGSGRWPPRPLEDHDELRWVSIREGEEALSLPWIPADLPIVQALLANVAAAARAGSVPGS
ncbi:hypothetical protein [Arthrobacter sp. K5]|uniref:8-oxo-dGTP diphosphatase n=1 Tax=Arthrobacter sp. K5 TaxID=2839623 RepID=A0AAU8ERM2_9MICC